MSLWNLGTGCPRAHSAPSEWEGGTAGWGLLSKSWQPTGHCSLSTDQPDEELPVPQQALASITHEHRVHHSAVLPLLPGCSCLPLLHHLVVSTHEATAQGTGLPAAWRRRAWGDHGPCPWHPPAAGPRAAPGKGGASQLLVCAHFLQLFLVLEAGMIPLSSPGHSEAGSLEDWTSEAGSALAWGQ